MTTRPVNLVRALPGTLKPAPHEPPAPKKKSKGGMNKLEAQFAAWMKQKPDVAYLLFASIKLRLADRTWYTPDFVVWWNTGLVSVYEVKGSWRAPHQEDSRVKIKVAAELYPMWAFYAATHSKRAGWKFEPFVPRQLVEPMRHTKSSVVSATKADDKNLRDKFFAALHARLDKGAEAYGDRSFRRTPEDLIGELQQEALDLAGWGFVLWARLGAMQEAARVVR